jgi:hypothetical protein
MQIYHYVVSLLPFLDYFGLGLTISLSSQDSLLNEETLQFFLDWPL